MIIPLSMKEITFMVAACGFLLMCADTNTFVSRTAYIILVPFLFAVWH